MRLLLKLAIQNRKHLILLFITMISMIFLTAATQIEMFSLGVMAKTGPDFFTLFAPEKNGRIQQVDSISKEQVAKTWEKIAPTGSEVITREEANLYMTVKKGHSIIQQMTLFLDKYLNLYSNLPRLALLLVLVALFKAVALFSHRYVTNIVSIRVSRDLRQKYFEHIQVLPMSFYQQYDIGSLSSRASGDAGTIASALNSWFINYLHTPFAIVTTLTACFLISWKLSLVIFGGFPLIFLPIFWIARRIKRIAKQMQRNQEGFAGVLIDFLMGIQTVKVFAMEEFSLNKYREQNNRMACLEEKSARYGNAARPILHVISSLFFAAVILYGLYIVQMGIAELLVFCALLYAFYDPVKKFAEEHNNIQRGIAAAERMYEVLDLVPSFKDDPNAISLKSFEESIEFRNVSFRYNEAWVLRDLSFTVHRGETVAIVGPTGAGKSTIVQLIPRLYEVEEGEILIDGKPLKAYTQRSIRENIAFVPQKPFLFFDTVKENISFGRASFTKEEIVDAARRAYAEEFIVQLPGEYNAKLSEMGKNLSGGQQQRLAIARALIKKAPILVMDEATSSLDAISEGKIKDAIAQLKGSMTQIIIAHRFSTIEHADKIIYLEKGRKVAEGTKDELLATCDNFRLMWEMMYNAEKSEIDLEMV